MAADGLEQAAKAAEKYKTDTLNALKAIADKAEQTRAEAALQYADAKLAAGHADDLP